MPLKKQKSAKLKKAPVVKMTKSQVRSLSELALFYRQVHEYSLREEAYVEVLKSYIKLRKPPELA